MTESHARSAEKCFYCRGEAFSDGPPCKYCGNTGARPSNNQAADEVVNYKAASVELISQLDALSVLERDQCKTCGSSMHWVDCWNVGCGTTRMTWSHAVNVAAKVVGLSAAPVTRRASMTDTAEPRATGCEWKADEEGVWTTGCGQAFVLEDGGPLENSMKFCCYCGLILDELPYEEQEDDDGTTGTISMALTCPNCGSKNIERHEVDICVGAQLGPWYCMDCSWQEPSACPICGGEIECKTGCADGTEIL